jgi:hypothetical protein
MERLLSYQLIDRLAVHNSMFCEAPFKKGRRACSLRLVGSNLKPRKPISLFLSTGLVDLGSKITRFVEDGYAAPLMIHFLAI